MFFALAWRIALGVAVLLCAVGCSQSIATSSTKTDAGVSQAIAFDQAGTLLVMPGTTVTVGLKVAGSPQDVQVWLEGAYQDASLDAGDVTTSEEHADVTLHTPSAP